ncbi:DUF3244 domain-containing protein [Bacteroides sp. OttesenSCG-928-J23]|nr:DUF3244 domain-containing protein [Bacteroides sp. OttesenSCG-928-J23]MDL2306025.1 DUF3244 domain-containing protein [Bacteroides sp. OttesenSCG-928-D19]
MKNLIITLFVLAFGFTSFSFVNTNEILLEGDWGSNKGARSLLPSKPQVFMKNCLQVYFADILQDVNVAVVDADGNEVYQSAFSIPYNNYLLEVPMDGYSGMFIITITSRYGVLTGTFFY